VIALVLASTTGSGGDWLSNHATLIVGVVGIVVSGLLGPATTVALSRRSARQQFKRDLIVSRREDLARVLDEAALLLGAGGTNLRILKEAQDGGEPVPPAAGEWARSVFPLGQRLRLRLSVSDEVVRAYDDVRDRLTQAQEAIDDQAAFDDVLARYEDARAAFLDASRAAIQATVDESKEI
jgi:hypothetical protein